jgi:flavorubredoxin
MAHVLDSIARKGMNGRKAFYYGSFGWSRGAEKEFQAIAQALSWETAEMQQFRGAPTVEDLTKAENSAAAFARSIREGAA